MQAVDVIETIRPLRRGSIEDRRMKKLAKLTGRKASIDHLENLLFPSSFEEAQENREELERNDRLKKVFGARPSPVAASPTSPSDHKRINKIKHVTGRRRSVDTIAELLMPDSAEQARQNARLLEKSDKMKYIFGSRPSQRSLKRSISSHTASDFMLLDAPLAPPPSSHRPVSCILPTMTPLPEIPDADAS